MAGLKTTIYPQLIQVRQPASRRLWARVLALTVLIMLFLALYAVVIRPWFLTWGATEAEQRGPWPGDELTPSPALVATHAVTVDAPTAAIWPWIVQMGQGRGGLYSYEMLENLIGCDLHNADRVHPEWQDVKVGDTIRFIPDGYMGMAETPKWTVVGLEPNRALILGGWAAWILEPIDGQSTRLIQRERTSMVTPILEPIDFVMSHRMMTGIKERAEGGTGSWAADTAQVVSWVVVFVAGLVGAVGVLTQSAWSRSLIATGLAWAVFLFLLFAQPVVWLGIALTVSVILVLIWSRWPSPRFGAP